MLIAKIDMSKNSKEKESKALFVAFFPAGAPSGGLGFSANADVGFPGQGFLNTALTIVFALVGFSLLIQLVTKIAAAPFIADLFEGRSLSPDQMNLYTNMAMQGIQKLQEIYGPE